MARWFCRERSVDLGRDQNADAKDSIVSSRRPTLQDIDQLIAFLPRLYTDRARAVGDHARGGREPRSAVASKAEVRSASREAY